MPRCVRLLGACLHFNLWVRGFLFRCPSLNALPCPLKNQRTRFNASTVVESWHLSDTGSNTNNTGPSAVPFVETERLGFPPPVDEPRNFEGVFLAHEQWKYCTAINSILVWLRCFEHLRAFPFMGYIVKVLASAVSPILVVCISFSIVTYAFALAYVLAFSGGIHGYRTIEYGSAKVCPTGRVRRTNRARACALFVLQACTLLALLACLLCSWMDTVKWQVLRLHRASRLLTLRTCSWTITTMTRQLRGLDDFDDLRDENRLLGEHMCMN